MFNKITDIKIIIKNLFSLCNLSQLFLTVYCMICNTERYTARTLYKVVTITCTTMKFMPHQLATLTNNAFVKLPTKIKIKHNNNVVVANLGINTCEYPPYNIPLV